MKLAKAEHEQCAQLDLALALAISDLDSLF